jgi:hypothetical protein
MSQKILVRMAIIILLTTMLLGIIINIIEAFYFWGKTSPFIILLIFLYSIIGLGLVLMLFAQREKITNRKIALLFIIFFVILFSVGILAQICLLSILIQVK